MYQLQAMERIAAKGDHKTFFGRARNFKSLWGDAEALFGGDLHKALGKIKAAAAKKPFITPPATPSP